MHLIFCIVLGGLVDDFEDGFSEHWASVSGAEIVIDPADSGNHVLEIESAQFARFNLPDPISDTESTTLYMEIRWADSLSGQQRFLAFEDGTSGSVANEFFDDGTFSQSGESVALDTQYSAWLEFDHLDDEFRWYMQGGEWSEPTLVNTRPRADGFGIDQFHLQGTASFQGSMYVDNVWQGVAVGEPPPAVPEPPIGLLLSVVFIGWLLWQYTLSDFVRWLLGICYKNEEG